MEQLQTEHGIFTSNELTGQTAEEAYQDWLAKKDLSPQITETERLAIAEQAINDLMMVIMMNGGM